MTHVWNKTTLCWIYAHNAKVLMYKEFPLTANTSAREVSSMIYIDRKWPRWWSSIVLGGSR